MKPDADSAVPALGADPLDTTLYRVHQQLLAMRNESGHWTGELSSSALSTATAVCALAIADPAGHRSLIERGIAWLAANANEDCGWGDTTLSKSNISTTLLAWAAFAAAGEAAHASDAVIAGAESWIARHTGGLEPDRISSAVIERYGNDRTFSVPILTMCALSGRLGKGSGAWRHVIPLPFELAACPQHWFRSLRLPVVSYALPALIAIGHSRFHHRPPRNPVTWLLRTLTSRRALRLLEKIQPASGGFLEAIPLTSFVVMSLAGSNHRDHPVVPNGLKFLRDSARSDGSWAIDTNLATWVTTLSVNALAAGGAVCPSLNEADRTRIADWIAAQQYVAIHPYTDADPGGWAWTDLSGGVPDADDTAGALLALHRLGPLRGRLPSSGNAAIRWLLDLQNADGGIPTFCKGWGTLPFDRSAADLTAHALSAFTAWTPNIPPPVRDRIAAASARALGFLKQSQRPDGAWSPLWFGNEHAPGEENLTYGTARVLTALCDCDCRSDAAPLRTAAMSWLVGAQNADGSWGGGVKTEPSIEETALAVEALAHAAGNDTADQTLDAISRGVRWLMVRTDSGRRFDPSPIGFYFAKLWYYERLYPLIFVLAALGRAAPLLRGRLT